VTGVRLNHCRGSGASVGGGPQGGDRRHPYNKVECKWCGKKLQVTKQGRLRAHGTREA